MSIVVSECYIYPLKSGGAQRVEKLHVLPRGPRNDREWMLVDENGRFLSQRDKGCEKLSLVTSTYNGDVILFYAEDKDVLSLNSALIEKETSVSIWKDDCTAYDAGDQAARWFSDYLGLDCRLVKLSEQENHKRLLKEKWGYKGAHVGFADGFPLLITSHPSLNTLKENIEGDDDITMGRFRPNIVLNGNLAFEEDILYDIRIGEVRLHLVKPCTRCKITTVDQETGQTPSKEPLKTLTRVRRGKSDDLVGVFFGQNAVPMEYGDISEGDVVEVIQRREMHSALRDAVLRYTGS